MRSWRSQKSARAVSSFAEDSPDRVVWTAEDEDFGVGFDRGFHRVDIRVQRSRYLSRVAL